MEKFLIDYEGTKFELVGTAAEAVNALWRENDRYKQRIAELEAENGRLRKTLDECADDLESYVEHEYASMHDYPDIHRRYERDIEPVRKARKLLAAMEGE